MSPWIHLLWCIKSLLRCTYICFNLMKAGGSAELHLHFLTVTFSKGTNAQADCLKS